VHEAQSMGLEVVSVSERAMSGRMWIMGPWVRGVGSVVM